ncbi:FtsQ-type POTRA domain-containing protein [Cryobacterium lactosi]|uniref:FtsQ-type POTRA domain-containing protein n=1 Tax=Cryobacterium lactosi TaxID=1259202 RepID=A0A4R9BVA8_9MICO|nr:FtsQ-type POTRA domain-containing protein [Cryobacterium lactosi]TFD91662.1 FtsQ-type POTRA domain-containing protein [Cryobacterium lactosi]
MKRPAGPPAAPAAAQPSGPQPPAAPQPRQKPARGSNRAPAGNAAARKGAASRAEPEAVTEPITLPPSATSAAAGDRPQARKATKPPQPTTNLTTADLPPTNALPTNALPTSAPKSKARKPKAQNTTARRSDPQETAEASDAPLTARAARGRLRTARRARKQYERSEVRRFTSRSRHRRNLWIAAAGTVVALVAFVLVGVFSPLMALRTIEITGTNRIPAADVAQALDGQLGTPLPLLDLTEVKDQLSEFSLIRSYVTESRPPDTLVVRIVEREPIGAITSTAGFDLVDAAGVVIQSGPDRPEGYPRIDSAGGASGAGFQAAIAVVRALPEGIRGQLDTVTAATKDDVTLTLGGGARVVWGNAERSEYKAVVLAALLVSHPVGSVTEYDVSSPDSAVVR